MSLWDTIKEASGFIPVVGPYVETGLDLGEQLVAGSGGEVHAVGSRTAPCPGGIPIATVQAALVNSPTAETNRIRAIMEDPFHRGAPFTPTGISVLASGGDDCNFNTDRGRADAQTIRDWAERWGQQQATSWTPAAPAPGWPTSSSTVQPALSGQFAGPSGAPLGVPLWAWVLIGVALFVVATGRAGDLIR